MATATLHPSTTINECLNTLQDRDLLSLFLSTAIHEIGHTNVIEANFDKINCVEDKIYGYRNLTSTYATTAIPYNTGNVWMLQNESPLTALLSDLRDLLKEEEEDDYGILKPTYHAFATALNLVMEISMFIHAGYPFAAVSTDSEGGIRIEWVKGRGEIRLIIPASNSKPPYIYYEFDDKYGVDRNANAVNLLRWLNRLNTYGTIAATAYVSTITWQYPTLSSNVKKAMGR